jgi:hypothetical protein
LKPVVEKQTDEIHPFIVGYFRNFQRMIRKDHRKYVFYPDAKVEQFFDLKLDPHEKTNLISDATRAAEVKELRSDLHRWLKEHGDPLFAK